MDDPTVLYALAALGGSVIFMEPPTTIPNNYYYPIAPKYNYVERTRVPCSSRNVPKDSTVTRPLASIDERRAQRPRRRRAEDGGSDGCASQEQHHITRRKILY